MLNVVVVLPGVVGGRDVGVDLHRVLERHVREHRVDRAENVDVIGALDRGDALQRVVVREVAEEIGGDGVAPWSEVAVAA